MAGRKPQHSFNTLEVGQKTELKGKALEFSRQFIYQYQKSGRELVKIKQGKRVFVMRIK